jgi:hypothetical protein
MLKHPVLPDWTPEPAHAPAPQLHDPAFWINVPAKKHELSQVNVLTQLVQVQAAAVDAVAVVVIVVLAVVHGGMAHAVMPTRAERTVNGGMQFSWIKKPDPHATLHTEESYHPAATVGFGHERATAESSAPSQRQGRVCMPVVFFE